MPLVAAAAAAAVAAAGPPPQNWCDCRELYPKPEEIATALQDVGTRKKHTRKGKEEYKTKFTLIEKLGVEIYNNIQKVYKPEGLDKNVSRGKIPLCLEIIQRRRHCDINETDAFFHQFGKDGKVFLITNDPTTCGIDLVIKGFQEQLEIIQSKNCPKIT